MDPATDSLLEQQKLSSKVTLEEHNLKPKAPGVKLDILNECQMFLKAEDGGGDAQMNINENIGPNPVYATLTPILMKENSTELQIVNSNPECDIEGVPELPNDDGQFPDTVTVLDEPNGGKVYIVGTAHFSLQSQEDVARVIQEVQPHIVMVELCEQRTNILLLDEEVILREAKNINILHQPNQEPTKNINVLPTRNASNKLNRLLKYVATIKQNGMINGIMYILLLNMSAHFTRELGMAPGGEFRRAMAEAKKLPQCHIHLGDRPINITLQRAIASLSWVQTLRFVWHLLTSNKSVSAEEVEKCKQKHMLEDMLEEMSEEFPTLKQVFVVERDLFLAHSLQLAANAHTARHHEPCRIVGIVGIGHVGGIVENWGKVKSEDIPPLLMVPPVSRSTQVMRVTVRVAVLGALLYGAYRLSRRFMS